jgi:chromosome segregation ATPase
MAQNSALTSQIQTITALYQDAVDDRQEAIEDRQDALELLALSHQANATMAATMGSALKVRDDRIALLEAKLASLEEQQLEEKSCLVAELHAAQSANATMQTKIETLQKQVDTYESTLVIFETTMKEIEVGRSEFNWHGLTWDTLYTTQYLTYNRVHGIMSRHCFVFERPRWENMGEVVKTARQELLCQLKI